VRSTKANAAKFLLRVPPEHWGEVKGVSLTASGAGYEVLWGRQGLLYGAYPGSSDGKAKEGLYTFTGDLGAIPEAPAWLLAEMRDAATHAEPEVKGFLKNRKALDFSDRTEDEIAEIAQDCLKVIPHLGAGSRDQWLQVGMALHDALPNELGLTLWSAWSADDPEYGEEWKDGNPCDSVQLAGVDGGPAGSRATPVLRYQPGDAGDGRGGAGSADQGGHAELCGGDEGDDADHGDGRPRAAEL
jgi:hypothetical protein